ncbi:hypothetical protein [Streptomyces sp. NBC_00638]|uniref:hypothetical protein n=1 Tax=Streptomyces sp. NBC_00638 TaxID=2975794 RepID=UPI002B1DB1C0|nr:hypothetical protein [Streptomyces sp. NBC_00638]
MSTERPDNDATDPVEGHAQGPVEGATERAVDGTVVGPDAGPTEGAVENPVDEPTEAPAEGSAEAPGEATAGDSTGETAERPVEARTEGAAQGPAESPVQGPPEGAAGSRGEDTGDGPAQEPVEGAAEGRSEGPGEGTSEGHAEGAGEGSVEGHAEGSAEGHAEEAGEGSVEGPAEAPAEGSVVGPADGTGEGSFSGIVGGPVVGAGAGGARRRNTPAVVASVVAAVLLVGGGGAYFAATASGGGRSGTPGGDATPPPLALDGYSESTTSTGSTGGTAGIAPGEPNPYGATYRADGELPAGPGSARVRWAEGRVTGAEVARLAKALRLSGTPRLAGDTWMVGSVKDAAEPNLRVNADAPGTWTFSSYIPGTDNCPSSKLCRPIGSGSLTQFAPDPVSEAAAKKAAAPVLKAVGQDDAKLDASQLMDRVRVVNADPLVGGLPTYGWTTGLRIDVDGHVIGGSGQLKAPVEGDTYPVVGARKTLDLMNGSASASGDGRMGIGGCASPVPLKDRDEMPCEHPTPAPKPEAVTVEKATFGLAAHRANGRQALVPSWLFEVRSPGSEDTYTVTHPAVDPKFLASTAPSAQPTPVPTAVPTAPQDEPSSPAATRDVDIQGYTAEGKDLTVGFTGGVCADYTVSASESSGTVTVTVTEKPWKNKVCILIAKIYEKTVHLEKPLDGRKVVGTDGQAIHEGRITMPEASGAASAGPR